MMVIPISVEITVNGKTRLVMGFAAMVWFLDHVALMCLALIYLCLIFTTRHNASRMTASMQTLEIVMANAFIIGMHVMVSVQKAGHTVMVAAQSICTHVAIPVLKAGKGVGVTNA